MKKLLTLFLLLACLPGLAQTHVTFTLANFTSTPVTNRNVWITPMSTPTVSGGSVITGDRYITNSGTTGIFTLSNAVVGLYYVQIKAPPSETAFKVLVTATNLGTIQASTILSADSTATFPAGTVAWAAATTDARYAPFGSAGVAVAAGTNTTAVTNGAVVTISSTGGGSGVSVAAGTNSLAVTNGSLVTVSGTGNAVWATNLSKGGVFISPNFTGTTGNNNNAVRIQGNSVLLTLNDTNQTLSLNGIFSGTGSLLTDLNYNYITNPPAFQPANANLTNFATLGTNTFLNTNDTTNAAYVIANQFSIPSWAEGGGVNFQYTWNTNFANSGAAMIKSQNTNYPIYVTTITPGTLGSSNFFVKSGRVFYPTNDPTAKYIGFGVSNVPTRIGVAWRVFDQNRGVAVNWLQLVLACSTNAIVTAPGNAGINVAQGIHWTLTPDLGASAVGLFTSGAGSGNSFGSMPMSAPAPNYASSPLGGRTTINADTPDVGEVFIMEMMHTPAMGNTIQFRYRNQTYTTNDPTVASLWGRYVMAEIYSPTGTYPVSANYELIAMWAGTKPEDLINGQVTMDLAGGTNLNASELRSGTAPTARLGSGSANSSSFLRGDQVWAVPPGGGDVAQSAQNNLTGSNSLSGLTMFSNNAAMDSAHQLSLSNITASSVVATDAGKRLTNLLNGGANTFLQGTTPPTYTSIPDAALSSNAALRNASNNFSGLLNLSNNAAMDAASTLSLSNLSASSVLVSTSAKQVSSIAGGGAGKYLEGTTPPTWTIPAANVIPTNAAWSTNGNNGLNAGAFLGTLDAQFLRFKVNGESSGTIKTNYIFTFGSNQTDNVGSPYSVILGGFGHSMASGGTASSIIGGQFNTNNASVSNSVILGGSHNIMNTPINGQYGNNVIVGGEGNTIGAGGWDATVIGGHNNTASGTYSTVIGNSSGGTASGSGAIVLGSSTASATDTIAIGPSITASHANSTSLSALSSGTDASGVISLFAANGTFVGGAAGLGIGITGMPAGGLWLTNSLLNTNLNGSIVQMTNGTLQISNNASASGSVIVGSNIFQIDTVQIKKALQVDTNGNAYFGGTNLVATNAYFSSLSVTGAGPSVIYGDANQTNSLAVSPLGTQTTNANGGYLFQSSSAKGIYTNNLVYATNSGSALTPDFSKGCTWLTTNAAFTFLAPINVNAGLFETTTTFVTNSTAAAVAITCPTAGVATGQIKTNGTWNVTNVTVITWSHHGNYMTNAISLPLF